MTSGAFELGAPLPPELDTEHCPCWSFDQTELSPRTSWRELGEGSFGCVYLAHWLGTEVAVKMNASDKANRYEGIFRDVRYLSNNPHPNVVQIFGAFQTRSKLCVVMEYVPRSLRDRRVVNRVDIVTVLADVARALVRLHSTGVIHRDVKARNVLITSDYRVAKLADFGLARPLVRTRAPTAPAEAAAEAAAAAAPEGHAPLTDDDNKEDSESRRAAQCAMTPRVGPRKYRAPEVEDGLPYGCPCDMYSFGVMVRELLDQLKRRVVRRYGVTIDFLRELSLLCMRDNPGQRPSALEVLTVLQVHLREGHLPLISRTAPAGVLRTRLFGDPADGGGEHGGHKRGRDGGEHRHSYKKRRSSREPSRSRTGTSDAVLRLAAEQGGPLPLEDLDSSDSKSADH